MTTNQSHTSRRIPYKWELLVLLWIAFCFNQADRQIYNNLLPQIQPDLQLSNEQAGLVATVFTAIYGILVPISGYAGDALRRKWVIIGALALWSAATLLTGLAGGIVGLIVFRGLATGAGEAFYYPSANALIGQLHQRTRALAMGIHQTANYIGVAISFLGALVGECFGWRNAFYLFGGLGVAWALWMVFRMEDTPQPQDGAGPPRRPPVPEVLKYLKGKPTVMFLAVSFACHVFANIGYLTWMPTYLHEKFALSLTAASFWALSVHYAASAAGVLLGGHLSDRLVIRRRAVRMEFEWIGLLFSAPFLIGMAYANTLVICLVASGLYGIFRGVYDSNLFAAPFDVTAPRYRSSMVGFVLSFGFIIGAAAPYLLGAMKKPWGLEAGIVVLGAAYIVGAVAALVALYAFFGRDFVPEELLEETSP
ncbi:MAG: MFS transporter [Rhodopirellula sp.]|nr:MFS transporter [Rhodopirellula sp.]